MRMNYFHAWVLDYVTFADDQVTSFGDARLLYFFNTEYATLSGCDAYAEYDLYPRWTLFGKLAFVEGYDQVIERPLPSIPPLDTWLGVRWHGLGPDERWGVEVAARIVNDQSRLGALRTGQGDVTVIEERTPGFTVWNVRGYYNHTKNLRLTAGIENVFNLPYQEHLDLRLLGPNYPGSGAPIFANPTRVLSPGFTPYASVQYVF